MPLLGLLPEYNNSRPLQLYCAYTVSDPSAAEYQIIQASKLSDRSDTDCLSRVNSELSGA